MYKQKLSIILIILISLAISSTTYASISVGVKDGDWIEYHVNITGNVPEDHNVIWAKMEITAVLGSKINLIITSTMSNASTLQEQIVLNLETGLLGDDFIIPANLTTGNSFYNSQQGNITIAGIQQLTVAGAERTIIFGYTSETTYFWDQNTGIMIEAKTHLPDYNMTTKIDKTNMWQQTPTEVSPTIIYALVIAVLVIAISSILLISNKKKHGATN